VVVVAATVVVAVEAAAVAAVMAAVVEAAAVAAVMAVAVEAAAAVEVAAAVDITEIINIALYTIKKPFKNLKGFFMSITTSLGYKSIFKSHEFV
jgi:hypothetical protein